MRRPVLCLALALFACVAPPVAAQVPEFQLKAEFLERFTRFIEWPAPAGGSENTAPFIIAVVGRSPFGPHLQALAAGRRIKGRAVVVRENVAPEQAAECDLLFIPATERGRLRDILARTAGRPVLTVGDGEGFARSGVLINFADPGERIEFDINESAVRSSGLAVSARLLRLARRVDEENAR